MKDWKFLVEKYVLRQHRPPKHEPLVVKRMKKVRGKLFVDIGCNQKMYADLLRKNFERVITIDPNPKWNADCPIALSNFDGSDTFYIGMDTGSADSLVHNPHIQGQDWQNGDRISFTVQVKRFDSLGLHADLAKVDVEGAEFQVLEGMTGDPPKHLMVELHDERREAELSRKMVEMGYRVSKVDNSHFFGEQEWTRTSDGDWKNTSSGKTALDQ